MFDYSARPDLLKNRVILVTGAGRVSAPPLQKPMPPTAQLSCCWAGPKPASPRSMTKSKPLNSLSRW